MERLSEVLLAEHLVLVVALEGVGHQALLQVEGQEEGVQVPSSEEVVQVLVPEEEGREPSRVGEELLLREGVDCWVLVPRQEGRLAPSVLAPESWVPLSE